MTGRSLRVPLLLGFFAGWLSACAPGAPPKEGAEELASHAVAALPDTVRRTFFDFGGKLHLVAYELSKQGSASPGEAVTLKLYWKRVAPLGEGWNLFTHIEDQRGRQLWNFDRDGSFRAALNKSPAGLSALELGKVYVDEQSLTMPKAEQLAPSIRLIVGAWNHDMRLPLVSGVSNGHEAAVLAHFDVAGLARPPARQELKAAR